MRERVLRTFVRALGQTEACLTLHVRVEGNCEIGRG